jgi:peptidylamidoglycolate lyase
MMKKRVIPPRNHAATGRQARTDAMMRKILLGALGLALLAGAPAVADGAGKPQAGYHVVHGWPVLPAGRALGSVAGVSVDASGNVWVFHRAGRTWSDPFPPDTIAEPTVAQFDGRTGRLLREWGAGQFVMPHGLTVDPAGNIWLTDVALQQVFKCNPEGKVLLTLGEARVAGNDGAHFNRPTQIAVAADGSVLVADGYINTRIARFTPDGHFLGQWGTPGKGAGQFDHPHAIVIDGAGRVYVADRENDRVQVFDASGHYLEQWASPAIGRPYGVALVGTREVAIADGGVQPAHGPDRSGLVITDRHGRLIERVGRFGNQDGQFMMAHHIAADPNGAIYVVDITGRRVQKFVR